MRSRSKGISSNYVKKLLSVLLMAFCLLVVTSINYFIYPKSNTACAQWAGKSSDDPSAPTEEKNCERSVVNIAEEYVSHTDEHFIPEIKKQKVIHPIKLGDLEIVHVEFFSPPPNAVRG
jgi:hypothetical protein